MARLVIADVESDLQESAKANKSVDKILQKAERKPEKQKKAKPSYDALTEQEKMLRADLASPNPYVRSAAWEVLHGRGGA